MRCSSRCSPTRNACARRPARSSPTCSTSASAAPTSARRWPCSRWRSSAHPELRFHFVSNVDGHDIAPVLKRLDPATTLVIVASKTFTTQETLANANVAREWFIANGGTDVASHFVGVTTNIEAAAQVRHHDHVRLLGLGRRPLLAVERDRPVAGDRHRRRRLPGSSSPARTRWTSTSARAPLAHNLPVQLALIDVWYRNFHGFTSRSVAPYHQGLKRLPAYLQQLEMESNGKRVDVDGRAAAVRHQPRRLGRARHQRPARVLPDAAPGHGRRAGRVHRRQDAGRRPRRPVCRPARQAARQLPRAVAGADAGQAGRRGRARVAADGLAHDRARGDRRAPQPSRATAPARRWCWTR